MLRLRLFLRARRKDGEADKDEGEEKAAKHHGGRLRMTLIRWPTTGLIDRDCNRPKGRAYSPSGPLSMGPDEPSMNYRSC